MPTLGKRKRAKRSHSRSKKRIQRAGVPNPHAEKLAMLRKQIGENPRNYSMMSRPMHMPSQPVVESIVSPPSEYAVDTGYGLSKRELTSAWDQYSKDRQTRGGRRRKNGRKSRRTRKRKHKQSKRRSRK